MVGYKLHVQTHPNGILLVLNILLLSQSKKPTQTWQWKIIHLRMFFSSTTSIKIDDLPLPCLISGGKTTQFSELIWLNNSNSLTNSWKKLKEGYCSDKKSEVIIIYYNWSTHIPYCSNGHTPQGLHWRYPGCAPVSVATARCQQTRACKLR